MVRARLLRFVVKPFVFALALAPAIQLGYGAYAGRLGPNPIEAVTHGTGDWTLRFLLLTLSLTPVRMVTGWNLLARFRRMFGLFAFFYGTLHFMTYLWLDKFFVWADILHDIPRRPFITAGFLGFAVLVPLAATSTAATIRWLGGRRWRALHRLVYVAAVAGVVHYWWLVKADISRPRTYAVTLAVLFVPRAWAALGRPLAPRARTATGGARAPGAFAAKSS